MTLHKFRHLGLQLVRRLVQLSVCGLIVLLAFLSLYAHYRAARAVEDLSQSNAWEARMISAIDRRVDAMEKPHEFLDGYKGTLWSMRLAGYDWSDPLAAAEVIATTRAVYIPLVVSILAPVVLTLLLGRVFCSWICPAGLLFEVTGKLRKLLRFAECPPAEVKFSHANKYIVLAVGLAAAAIVGLPMFALIYPPAVLSRVAHAWIFGTSMTGMLILLGSVVLVELVLSPRWWCRTVCPGGALYGLLGWPRLLRVRLNADLCNGCRKCEPVCEPGLNPVLQSSGIECDNCGVCIHHCPEKALRYTIGLPAFGKPRRRKPPKTASKKTKTASVAASVSLFLFLAVPGPVLGHHILGLPHYSYKENYPQVPTLEYPASSGPYDLVMTSYPGNPVPGEAASIAFYIKNRETGRPYGKPVTVRVLQTFTFGDNRTVQPPTEHVPCDNLHKCLVTFSEDGEFIVELTLDVEGRDEVIPFLMVAGDPSSAMPVVFAAVGGLAVFIIIVRAVKVKCSRSCRNVCR